MLALSKFIKKEIELRENLVGYGFLDPPQAEKVFSSDPLEKGKFHWESDYRMTSIGK